MMDHQSMKINETLPALRLPAKSKSQSLVTAVNKFITAVDEMEQTIMIPNKLKDIYIDGTTEDMKTENNDLVLSTDIRNGDDEYSDLYNFYTMLGAVKAELSRDPTSDRYRNDDLSDQTNTQSHKAARAFQNHLRGLFNVLHQLTNTAKTLTDQYQDTVGVST